MLDKLSEKVLKYLIGIANANKIPKQYSITLYEDDVTKLGISFDLLKALCTDLLKKDYIEKLNWTLDEHIRITLSYKGISYFEYKTLRNTEYRKQLLTTTAFSILVSVASSILTTWILS